MIYKISKNIFTFVLFMLILTACKTPTEKNINNTQSLANNFEKKTLIINSGNDVKHKLQIYLAEEPYQQRRGLMFVRNMPENTGMLFIYKRSGVHSMWMKNTYIPLDLIFVREDGLVSSIIYGAEPMSLKPHSSIEPIKYVLELNAGVAKKLTLNKKSRLILEDD